MEGNRILSDEQIKKEWSITPCIDTESGGVSLGRAIEQAVLQSPQVQQWRKGAERYQWLIRDAYITECYTDKGVILEVAGTDREVPIDSSVSKSIDAAMEKNTWNACY